jgi:hypothetical protein
MEYTELAEKRLRIIKGGPKCYLEAEFIKKFILEPGQSFDWIAGLPLIQVQEFCDRVHRYGGRVLGLHVSMDSPYPLFCIPYECYSDTYKPEWISFAISFFQNNKVQFHIVPTCDFEYSTLMTFL